MKLSFSTNGWQGISWSEFVALAKDAGFDGIELGDYLFPRLTTIRQPVDRLAMRGVSILIHCIEESSDAIHEIVPYQFVEGESVRALTE